MDQSARFWDKIAERYSQRPVADETAYQKKLQVTREYLQPDMQVLEFGCGMGRLLRALSQDYSDLSGVDISPTVLEHAKRHVPNTDLRLADEGGGLPFDSESFDRV